MKTVQEILAQCDPRFTGFAENGDYILSDKNGKVAITPAVGINRPAVSDRAVNRLGVAPSHERILCWLSMAFVVSQDCMAAPLVGTSQIPTAVVAR